MWKRVGRPKKRALAAAAAVFILALVCAGFTGCRKESEESAKVEDLAFTVVGEKDVPAGLSEILEQKREKPFKLTYADEEDMYIVIGEGPQKGGGYSVSVLELYRTESSVVIRTELTGPEKGEASGTDLSYPVLIVKTAYREEPVVFQ